MISDGSGDFPLAFLPGASHLLISRRETKLTFQKMEREISEKLILEGYIDHFIERDVDDANRAG